MVANAQRVVERVGVVPGDVTTGLVGVARREIGAHTLVGTRRRGRRRDQQVHPHVLGRDVVAHREVGLEQHQRPVGLREHRARQAHLQAPGAGQHVDALERVVRVPDQHLVLRPPLVERLEVQDDDACEVRVGARKPHSGEPTAHRRAGPGPCRGPCAARSLIGP